MVDRPLWLPHLDRARIDIQAARVRQFAVFEAGQNPQESAAEVEWLQVMMRPHSFVEVRQIGRRHQQ